MTQKTAVDWIIEQLQAPCRGIPSHIIEQAKQMDKEQHRETFKQSRQAKIFEEGMPPVWENFEQYYNKTYGTTDSN
jgi:hypothetical protein